MGARGVAGGLWLALLAARSMGAAEPPPTMATTYPGLVSGVLASATLTDLPDGVLLRAREVEITAKALDEVLAKSPKSVREQLRRNALFLLDELAAEKLTLAAAKAAAAKAQVDVSRKPDRSVIGDYLKSTVAQVSVADAEVAELYEKEKDSWEGVKPQDAKSQVRQMLLEEKQQAAVAQHVRELAKSANPVLSASWAKEQVALARDNPVDQARTNGKPSVVDFGATKCRPCVLMEPILKALRRKYEGRANVVFINVRDEPILGTRYGVRSIPVQVFFDKDGKEVLRHVGFLPQDQIEKRLGEMGVQ